MKQEKFRFDEGYTPPQEFDFSKMRDCPHCHNPLPHDALRCYFCGEPVNFSKKKKGLLTLVLLVLIIIFVLRLLR